MKHKVLATSLGFALTIGALNANALSLSQLAGSLEFKLTSVSTEQVSGDSLNSGNPAVYGNENTWAVGQVSGITDGFNTVWSPGGNEYLTFMLYGIHDISTIPGGIFGNNIYSAGATGGTGGQDGNIYINVYLHTSAPGDVLSPGPAGRSATSVSSYPGITDGTGASLWLRMQLIPGITTDDPSTPVDESTATLFQNATAISNPATGVGSFYANAVGGSAMAKFDTDGFTTLQGTTADFYGKYNINPAIVKTGPTYGCGDPNLPPYVIKTACWENKIDDPVYANAIPEPTALLIFGTGLLALVRMRRRS